MREIRQAYQLNELRACGLMRITRWSNRYQSRRDPQTELRVRLRDLACTRIRYGYRRLTVLLRREGWHVNTKRVYRLYREEGLELRIKRRAKRAAQARIRLTEARYANQRWSMDFVSDRLVDGRWFRILTVVDQNTRECLCAHADRSQSGEKVAEQLERVIALRGAPETITSDNGSEFAGQTMEGCTPSQCAQFCAHPRTSRGMQDVCLDGLKCLGWCRLRDPAILLRVPAKLLILRAASPRRQMLYPTELRARPLLISHRQKLFGQSFLSYVSSAAPWQLTLLHPCCRRLRTNGALTIL